MKYYAVEYHVKDICPVRKDGRLVMAYIGQFPDQLLANAAALRLLGGDKCVCSIIFVRARRWVVFTEQEVKKL
ncbi:hypothetical protein M2404_003836 [Rheinheimera pacifica]|uniref:hypothetical protein n=1 Tax=Rheinheimera pacifica TaxID=173990 RepID=UPI00216A7CA6|nr:hypothetical protein [Rheinheimera pacifica]MCS4309464.1 hypothetical protein [Rheinheimera pacifica]